MKKYLYILFSSFFVFSCGIIKKHDSPIFINGKIILSNNNLIDDSNLSDSQIYLVASYSRYPNPYFFLDCKEYLDFEERLNNFFPTNIDSLDKSKKIISVTKPDSLGEFSIEIPYKIYRNSWLINKSYPKYEYLMLIFVKNGYNNKIKLIVPSCDSIMNEFKSIKLSE